MRILVVCGAGASSTFVAQRLRSASTAVGLDWETFAGAESAIGDSPADLVLIGPHLAHRIEAIRSAASVPCTVLPDDVFGDRDGTRTLAIARDALLSSSDASTSAKGRS